jgi:hypothetical protein
MLVGADVGIIHMMATSQACRIKSYGVKAASTEISKESLSSQEVYCRIRVSTK